MEKYWNLKGKALLKQGIKQGRVEGQIDGLLSLVHDGYLTTDVAAKRAKEKYGIDEDEFRSMLASYHPGDDELLQG